MTSRSKVTEKVTPKRHLAKAVSWRILGTCDTFILAFVITGDIQLGAFISGTEVITKTALYYFHERVWYKHIRLGLKDV